MSISNLQFAEMEARLNRNRVRDIADSHPTEGSEAELQQAIEEEIKRLGWPYVHTRMDCATTYTVRGVPDFILVAPGGTVLWIECKTAKGKLTADQEGFGKWLGMYCQTFAVARSVEAFRGLVRNY